MLIVTLRKAITDVTEGSRILLNIHYRQHIYVSYGCVVYDYL